jgi:hypothetical protein
VIISTKPERVARSVCATLKHRDNVIPFRGKLGYSFLLTVDTERVSDEQLSSCRWSSVEVGEVPEQELDPRDFVIKLGITIENKKVKLRPTI